MTELFRPLTEDEVECRVSNSTPNGVELLIYKNARVDMNILDETVGPFGWKKEYQDPAHCTVSIWDEKKSQWISKTDVGCSSGNKEFAAKSLASDAFKRACMNWGIGRELYSGPSITYPANLIDSNQMGIFKVLRFEREPDDRNIRAVTISHCVNGMQVEAVRFAKSATGEVEIEIVTERNITSEPTPNRAHSTITTSLASLEMIEEPVQKEKVTIETAPTTKPVISQTPKGKTQGITKDTVILIGNYEGMTVKEAMQDGEFKKFIIWASGTRKKYDEIEKQKQLDYFKRNRDWFLANVK